MLVVFIQMLGLNTDNPQLIKIIHLLPLPPSLQFGLATLLVTPLPANPAG